MARLHGLRGPLCLLTVAVLAGGNRGRWACSGWCQLHWGAANYGSSGDGVGVLLRTVVSMG
ncbi:MAG: hypothetical protein QOF25_1649 [Mycobacterium sp.]|jgi:hypothetical protein|nr:hypothetical protein [Mycobacterium sp.]